MVTHTRKRQLCDSVLTLSYELDDLEGDGQQFVPGIRVITFHIDSHRIEIDSEDRLWPGNIDPDYVTDALIDYYRDVINHLLDSENRT